MIKDGIIAVTSPGDGGLTAMVDPRFGRCASFTFVEVSNGNIKNVRTVSNAARMAGGGAGIQSAQAMGDNGANVVLTGNVGPNAFYALQNIGIKMYTGFAGMTVQDAVDKYLSGAVDETDSATVGSHFGMGGGGGRGMGGGGGRGMGGGGGGGRGRSQY